MRDFRHFVDFYHNQSVNPCLADRKRTVLSSTPAIKINSVTDPFNIKMGVTEATATLAVDAPLETFKGQYPAILANLVGLSWWVRSGDSLEDEGVDRPWSNPDARHMDVILTTANPDGGVGIYATAFPLKGSLLVMHVKALPLNPHHIWAFNKYIDLVLLTGGMPSKRGFSVYWKKYTAEQERAGICMDDVYSPYDLENIGVGEQLGFANILDHDAELLRSAISGDPEGWMAIVRDMRKRQEMEGDDGRGGGLIRSGTL